MPAKKEPPLTDEERARRIRELAAEAGTSDDPEAFDRAFGRVVRGPNSQPNDTEGGKPELTSEGAFDGRH